MKEETRTKIHSILSVHKAETGRTAKMLLETIKDDCRTYGELKHRTRSLVITIRFDNNESLADRIEDLVENEMNDLPLTDRSE